MRRKREKEKEIGEREGAEEKERERVMKEIEKGRWMNGGKRMRERKKEEG